MKDRQDIIMEQPCKLVIIQHSSLEEKIRLMDILFTNLDHYNKHGIVLSDKAQKRTLKKYFLEEHLEEFKEENLNYIVFDDCLPEIFRSKKIKRLINEGVKMNGQDVFPVLLFVTVFPLKTFVTPLGLINTPKIFMPVKDHYTSNDIEILLRFMSVDTADGIKGYMDNITHDEFRAELARKLADRYDELNLDIIPQIRTAAENGNYFVNLSIKQDRVIDELQAMGFGIEKRNCNNIIVSW